MTDRRPAPPLVPRLLLRLILDPDAREVIEGDLEEEFTRVHAARGGIGARAWFWRHSLASLWSRRAPTPGLPMSSSGGPRLALERLGNDARVAVRQLAGAPGFTVVAVLALGLGIGLATTTFSIVRGSLLRGLPFENAHELVHFERQNPDEGVVSLAVTPHDYVDWRTMQTTFVDLGAYTDVLVVIGGEQVAAEASLAIRINTIALELLGVTPAMGRSFGPDDEAPGAPPVLVIGDGYWRTRLGGDPDVIGRTIRIDGVPTTIVGVMPPSFAFPIDEQLWLPLGMDLTRLDRGRGRLDAFGRLLPGRTIADAREEFERISANLQQEYPGSNAGISAMLQSFEQEYIGEEFSRTMLTMLVGAFLVLGIACANVANLLTARGNRRGQELAVRLAIGAGRSRVFTQLLTETAVLAALGGVVGLAIAYAGVAAFRTAWGRGVPLGLPHGLSNGLFWWQFEVDAGVLLFVLTVTAIAAVVAGLLPAFRATGRAPWEAMQGARSAAGVAGRRSGRALVVAQFALTAGLVTTAGLMVKSVYLTSTIDDGIASEQVHTGYVQLLAAAGALPENYPDTESRLLFWDQLGERLLASRRATAVGFTTSLPMTRAGRTEARIDGLPDRAPLESSAVVVSPGFFEVFEVDAVQGRLLSADDRRGGTPSAVVNRAFVESARDAGSLVGRRIRLGEDSPEEPWITIVGVVPDLWVNREREEPAIYLPLAQMQTGGPRGRIDRWQGRRLFAVMRTPGDGTGVSQALRELVGEMDPYVPIAALRPMDSVAADLTAQYQVYGLFYIAFGIVALVMATIGLYGVIAYSVGNRTAEIGIRMALGADSRGISRLVIAQGAVQLGLGLAAGLGLAIWLPFQVTRVLFEVEPWDPVVLVGVLAILLATGIVACWEPARRAAAVNPVQAMRSD